MAVPDNKCPILPHHNFFHTLYGESIMPGLPDLSKMELLPRLGSQQHIYFGFDTDECAHVSIQNPRIASARCLPCLVNHIINSTVLINKRSVLFTLFFFFFYDCMHRLKYATDEACNQDGARVSEGDRENVKEEREVKLEGMALP